MRQGAALLLRPRSVHPSKQCSADCSRPMHANDFLPPHLLCASNALIPRSASLESRPVLHVSSLRLQRKELLRPQPSTYNPCHLTHRSIDARPQGAILAGTLHRSEASCLQRRRRPRPQSFLLLLALLLLPARMKAHDPSTSTPPTAASTSGSRPNTPSRRTLRLLVDTAGGPLRRLSVSTGSVVRACLLRVQIEI